MSENDRTEETPGLGEGRSESRGWRHLVDLLWRRAPLSPHAYVALGAATSLSFSALAVFLYWLVATQALGLDMPTSVGGGPGVLDFLGWVALAPLSETLILGVLIGAARMFTGHETTHLLVGAVPLGLLHGFQGVTAVDVGGHAVVSTVGFLVFALAYVAWRREGFKAAFWASAGVHAVHNAVLFFLLVADTALRG